MNEKYLNVTDLCKYIYKSKSYVYKKVERNEIPFYKVGNTLLFERFEIDQWVRYGSMTSNDLPELPDF